MLQGLSDNLRNNNTQSTYPACAQGLSWCSAFSWCSWVCFCAFWYALLCLQGHQFYCDRFLISDNTDLINGVHSLLPMDVILLCSLHALVYMGETRDFQLFHWKTLFGTNVKNQVPERWSGLLKVFYQVGFLAGSFVLSISSASYSCTWCFQF